MTQAVDITKDGAVTVVAIDRPEQRNAVDAETAGQLEEAFVDFDRDREAAVAVLVGRGGTFCAGADLRALASGRVRSISHDGPGPMGPTRLDLSKPVLAAVEGHAVAGGLELALWCDLRIVSETAVFGVFSRRFGVPLVDGGTVRLPRIVGHGRALDLILTGRPVDATEAMHIGLADRVVAPGTALAAAVALAHQLAAFPQACLRNDRRSVLAQWGLDEAGALAREARLGRATIRSGEPAAGAARFVAGEGRGGTVVASPADRGHDVSS